MAVKRFRRFAIACLLLLVTCALIPVNTSAQGANYNFVNIDYPDAYSTFPTALNNNGAIVGYYLETQLGPYHGFLYSGGVYTTIDYPGGTTFPQGINDNGVITGVYEVGFTETHGFTYSDGDFTSFDYPGASGATNGQGINNNDEIVGIYSTGGAHGFIDNNGSFSPLNFPGADNTYPHAISNTGKIAGFYTASTVPFGFLYDGSIFTTINYSDGYETFAYGINDNGVVVGYSNVNSFPIYEVGFLWHAGQFTLINSNAFPQPYGINNAGQIVGTYNPSGSFHGFLATPSNSVPLQFFAATPCRLVDTRNTGGPIPGGTSRDFTVPQLGGCNIPTSAQAYSLNVTVVPQGPLGYLTIWPTGQNQPDVSTMNSPDGRTKANAAIVPAGSNGAVSVFVSNTSNVILDINGYFIPVSGSTLAFYPLLPCRVIDTRNPNGGLGGPFLVGQQERDFPVRDSSCLPQGGSAQAYSFNVTVVPHPNGEPLGYLTVWPQGQTQPGVSTLNNPTATDVANAAIVRAGNDGEIAVFASNDTDLVVDINGFFAQPGVGGLSLYPVTPCRVLDTRDNHGQPFSGTLVVPVESSPCAPSSTAVAYVFNATVVPSGALGYLTLWPNTLPQPGVSTLNALDGFVTSNMAIVPTINGIIDAFASNPTHLVLDISSYFAP